MRLIGIGVLLAAGFCFAQQQSDFKPATSNVLDAQYPKVDSSSRVQIRFKAPDATKVKLNFWSGPKMDMERGSDGYWTPTTPPTSIFFPTSADSAAAPMCSRWGTETWTPEQRSKVPWRIRRHSRSGRICCGSVWEQKSRNE